MALREMAILEGILVESKNGQVFFVIVDRRRGAPV